jgi:hypothetical protein
MPEKIQWEYHIEVLGSTFKSLKPEQIETALNEFGEMGWDVINLHQPQNSNRIWVAMKRPVTPATRRRRDRFEESW